jgi:hypothetical protein
MNVVTSHGHAHVATRTHPAGIIDIRNRMPLA